MKCIKSVILVGLALSLAACGVGDLSIGLPGEDEDTGPLKLDFPPGSVVEHRLPFRISGGIPPYKSSIEGCPQWVTLFPDQGILAGTGPAVDTGRTFFCAYHISDSNVLQPESTSFGLRLTVSALAPLTLPESVVPDDPVSLTMQQRARVPFAQASGGVAPYTYDLQCALPRGLGFSPDARTLSGTPLEIYRGPDCTYRVIDSATPPESVSRVFGLIVDPLDLETWRFRTRTLARSDHPVSRNTGPQQSFATLPHAIGGTGIQTYELLDVQPPLEFDADDRQLSYRHTGVGPPLRYTHDVPLPGFCRQWSS